MNRNFATLFLIFAAVLLLYYPILGVYFSQDDFFHFKVSQTDGSLKSFVNFFGFHPFAERGIAFYRPITREVIYNTFYSLFGLNVLPFRILSFAIHFINIFLIYFLIQKLFNKRAISLFTAFFFGITAANVAPLYYLAGGIQVLGATMFMLLTLTLFWKYLESKKAKFRPLSFVTFLLALGSHELAVALPILLSGLIFIREKSIKNAALKSFRELWFFFAILVVYIYLNVTQIGFSDSEEQYQTVFSLGKTLNSFAWYSVWALGLPEMLIDFVRPGLKLNPSLMRHWGEYFRIIFPTFFASIVFIGGAAVFHVFKNRKFFRDKKLWFLVAWFPVAILPVVFFPLHKSTYYLVPALPALWGAIMVLVLSAFWKLKKHRWSGVLLGGFLILLTLLSITSSRLGDSTYWAASRGRIAERLLNDMKSMYPQLPKGAMVYFKNDPNYPFVAQEWGSTSKQASFVLNGEDALQLFYHDSTLKVFYEDLGGVPKDFPHDKIYSLTAKLQ